MMIVLCVELLTDGRLRILYVRFLLYVRFKFLKCETLGLAHVRAKETTSGDRNDLLFWIYASFIDICAVCVCLCVRACMWLSMCIDCVNVSTIIRLNSPSQQHFFLNLALFFVIRTLCRCILIITTAASKRKFLRTMWHGFSARFHEK